MEALTRRRPLSSSYDSIPSAANNNNNNKSSEEEGPPGGRASPLQQQQGLRRSLGLVDVIFYGVGCRYGLMLLEGLSCPAEHGPSRKLTRCILSSFTTTIDE